MSKGRADPLLDLYFWKKITSALAINALTVPTAITLLFVSGLINEPLSKVISAFQKSYPPFFWPLDRFFDFAESYALNTAVIEELFTRGPIRILMATTVLFRKKMNLLAYTAYWSVGLFLNYQWAANHTVHNLVWIPVFVAGLPWLWLVIRTNRLWPVMFCHATANLSIYFLIKTYQFLY